MSLASIAADRPTLISLIAPGHGDRFDRLFGGARFAHAVHIPVHADTPSQRSLLAARIDDAVLHGGARALFVAHGTGCNVAAWWARLSPAAYVARIAGAVLIAPEDGAPGAFASPRTRLPFPSILADASDAHLLAAEWGSRIVRAPGHARRLPALVERFTAAIVARDVRVARAMLGTAGDW